MSRELDWDVGKVSRIHAGDRISPYRARQVARYLGLGARAEDDAMFTALAELAKADSERKYWLGLIAEADGASHIDDVDLGAIMAAARSDCQKQWDAMKQQLSVEDKLDDYEKVLREYVRAARNIRAAQKEGRKAG